MAFVSDPNFTKFIELFFGEGIKTTFRHEWGENFGDEPAQKVLLIHVPGMGPSDANDRLVKFWGLMGEMKDYPINLIIDTSYMSQEQYLEANTTKIEKVECQQP